MDFRDIHRKICGILHLIIAVCGQSHQVCPTALDLHHVAHSLFVQVLLRHHTEYNGSVLNQTDWPMFQFTGSVRLRVNVADLFHFQATFHANGIIDTSSNEESIFHTYQLIGKPLDALLVLQDALHLFRNGINLRQKCLIHLVGDLIPCLGKLQCQQICRHQLTAIRFCCCHGNFRPSKSIEHTVRLSGDGRANHIDDSQRANALFFCQTQCLQTIRRLSGLADDNHQTLRHQRHLPIAELRRQFHTNRQTGQFLNHILCCHSHMIRRTASHNIHLL